MMTVATSSAFHLPARLLFPKADLGASDATSFPFALLGLGDVVVPGLLASLALRYDASRCVDLRPRALAAIAAIEGALSALPADADRRAIGAAAADAALDAYDTVAEQDDAARGTSVVAVGTSGADGPSGTRRAASDAVMQQRRLFRAVLLAYAAGLSAAFAANTLTGAGQPALLYLCPATLGAVALAASLRGEVARVWAFVDVMDSPLRRRRDD